MRSSGSHDIYLFLLWEIKYTDNNTLVYGHAPQWGGSAGFSYSSQQIRTLPFCMNVGLIPFNFTAASLLHILCDEWSSGGTC